MSVYEYLKHKRRFNYLKTDEYDFYFKNQYLISKIESAFKFSQVDNVEFRLIMVNALIKAMMNKNTIEDSLEEYANESLTLPLEKRDEYIRSRIWKDLDNKDAPYFEVDKARIYIPFYVRGLNIIYNDQCSKLLEFPYNELKNKPISPVIDCFEQYNFSLYSSKFTNLILIKIDKSSAAFYHKEFETIFIINDQGRLDIAIPLFDKYLKNHNQEKLISRVNDVVDNFYSNNRESFIKSLYANQFVSKKVYIALRKKVRRKNIKKKKIVSKGKSPDEIL